MGAWGPGNFENDGALDFLPTVLGENGWKAAVGQLRRVDNVGEGDYLEADTCCAALVAVEVISAALGSPSSELPERPSWSWNPAQAEIDLAIRSVHRVATDSELSDLWAESGDNLSEWADVIDELLKRLGDDGL